MKKENETNEYFYCHECGTKVYTEDFIDPFRSATKKNVIYCSNCNAKFAINMTNCEIKYEIRSKETTRKIERLRGECNAIRFVQIDTGITTLEEETNIADIEEEFPRLKGKRSDYGYDATSKKYHVEYLYRDNGGLRFVSFAVGDYIVKNSAGELEVHSEEAFKKLFI